ncbi:hypothetical protein ACIFOT_00325 [Neobacillus sp. NRS-1170]|uniref:hypothetical protein n=1 Tax=Neobacillus sp. NRS-1170 TaxID=3233898 RepID=UPI003D2CDDC3
MKRYTYILFVLMIAFVAGCSSEKPSNKTKEKEEKPNEQVDVDKGLLSVKITLPVSMFEGQDIDQVIADAKKEGIEVTKNQDGSLTYKMSKAQHKKMMKEMKENITKTVEETKNSKDYASIKDITYNDDISEFTVEVDKEAYENSMDGFVALGLGMSGMMYQLFNGVDPNHYKVTIYIKDQASQKVFDQIVYPDALKEKSDQQ